MADMPGPARPVFIENRVVQKRRRAATALLAITAIPAGINVPLAGLSLTGFPPTVTVTGAEGTKQVERARFFESQILQPRRKFGALYQAIVSAPGAGPTTAVPTAVLNILGFAPTITQATPVFSGRDLQGERDQEFWQPNRRSFLHALRPPGSVSVTVETASLSLTGFEPTIFVSGNLFIPTATLTLTGFEPTITQAFGGVVNVELGQLNLSAFAPLITISGAIFVPTAQMTITGYPPTISFGAAPTETRFKARSERKRFKPT
jgi:hypothetical protein